MGLASGAMMGYDNNKEPSLKRSGSPQSTGSPGSTGSPNSGLSGNSAWALPVRKLRMDQLAHEPVCIAEELRSIDRKVIFFEDLQRRNQGYSSLVRPTISGRIQQTITKQSVVPDAAMLLHGFSVELPTK